MAQFRGIIRGNRGEASRLGSKASGIRADVDGWDSGVRVVGDYVASEDADVFQIYATSGSSHRGFVGHIGKVVLQAGDVAFIPAHAVAREVQETPLARARGAVAQAVTDNEQELRDAVELLDEDGYDPAMHGPALEGLREILRALGDWKDASRAALEGES